MKYYEKICTVCNKVFTEKVKNRSQPKRKTCSEECAMKHRDIHKNDWNKRNYRRNFKPKTVYRQRGSKYVPRGFIVDVTTKERRPSTQDMQDIRRREEARHASRRARQIKAILDYMAGRPPIVNGFLIAKGKMT